MPRETNCLIFLTQDAEIAELHASIEETNAKHAVQSAKCGGFGWGNSHTKWIKSVFLFARVDTYFWFMLVCFHHFLSTRINFDSVDIQESLFHKFLANKNRGFERKTLGSTRIN